MMNLTSNLKWCVIKLTRSVLTGSDVPTVSIIKASPSSSWHIMVLAVLCVVCVSVCDHND